MPIFPIDIINYCVLRQGKVFYAVGTKFAILEYPFLKN